MIQLLLISIKEIFPECLSVTIVDSTWDGADAIFQPRKSKKSHLPLLLNHNRINRFLFIALGYLQLRREVVRSKMEVEQHFLMKRTGPLLQSA